MTPKVFVDTNVLVYSVDSRHPGKRRAAFQCLEQLHEHDCGVISTQVLQEFYVSATRRLGIEPLTAKQMVHTLKFSEVVAVDPEIIKEAIDCSMLDTISFWDALIVVTAEKAHCAELLTEDLNDGQIIRGVRIRNPFAEPSPQTPAVAREVAPPYAPRSTGRRPRTKRRDKSSL